MAIAPLDTAELGGLLERVASMRTSGDDAERIDRIRHLEALKSAIAAAQLREAVALTESRRTASALRGESTARQRRAVTAAASEIALARRISPAQARLWAGNARVLTSELPGTFAALRAGRTTEWRALLVARETVFLSRDDRSRADRELAPRLEQLSDRGVEAEARRIAQRLDPAGAAERARNATADRRVSVRPAPDTMCRLSVLLPVAPGVAAYASLRRHADTLIGIGAQGTNHDGSVRTRDQVMADTLVERVTGQSTADAVPIEIELVMTDRTLLNASGGEEPATLLGYGPIPSDIARDLAVNGTAPTWLRRLYTRPGRSELIGVDSRHRTFTDGQKRFIRYRDQTCRTPWCDAPIRHTDHVRSHHSGGPTSVGNGNGLCEACNYAKETLGRITTTGPPGDPTITIRTPTGHEYDSRPPDLPGHRAPCSSVDLRWHRAA